MNESPLCPLRALVNAYDLKKEAGPYGPSFMYRQGKNLVPLTDNKFLQKLKLTLIISAAGLNMDRHARYSFRRGGATFAMRCGVPVELIKVQGDLACRTGGLEEQAAKRDTNMNAT